MKYNLLIVPEGSTLPEDLAHLVSHERDTISKIVAGEEKEVVVALSTREVQLIVEYRDLLDVDVRAIIGLKGAMYNAVWNTYASTMDRVTVDDLRLTLRESNDESAQAGAAAVLAPSRSTRVARAGLRTPAEHPVSRSRAQPAGSKDDDEADYNDDGAPAGG